MLLVYFLTDVVRAVAYFGHVPQYLVDTDPYTQSFWTDIGMVIYLLSPIILIVWGVFLCLPRIRYKGRHPVPYYLFAVITAGLCWLFLWHDATGYITWYID
jgi:hypothetical protein